MACGVSIGAWVVADGAGVAAALAAAETTAVPVAGGASASGRASQAASVAITNGSSSQRNRSLLRSIMAFIIKDSDSGSLLSHAPARHDGR